MQDIPAKYTAQRLTDFRLMWVQFLVREIKPRRSATF